MRHRKMNECHSEIFLTEILLHSSTDSAVQAKKRNTKLHSVNPFAMALDIPLIQFEDWPAYPTGEICV